jgi:hypothetical protein
LISESAESGTDVLTRERSTPSPADFLRYSLSSTLLVLSCAGRKGSFVALPDFARRLMCSIFHLVQNSFARKGGMGRYSMTSSALGLLVPRCSKDGLLSSCDVVLAANSRSLFMFLTKMYTRQQSCREHREGASGGFPQTAT